MVIFLVILVSAILLCGVIGFFIGVNLNDDRTKEGETGETGKNFSAGDTVYFDGIDFRASQGTFSENIAAPIPCYATEHNYKESGEQNSGIEVYEHWKKLGNMDRHKDEKNISTLLTEKNAYTVISYDKNKRQLLLEGVDYYDRYVLCYAHSLSFTKVDARKLFIYE